jgi:hypothetical protein
LAGLIDSPYLDRFEHISIFRGSIDADELVRFVEKGLTGRLRQVALHECAVTTGPRCGKKPDSLASALNGIAALPQFGRLECLDLTYADVDRNGASALLKASGFAALQSLHLKRENFRTADREALTTRYGARLWWA